VRWPPSYKFHSWSNESVVRQSLAGKNVNTEAEETTALEAVTRLQPVKIEQTTKTACCSEL
jgi:hypothetical protein